MKHFTKQFIKHGQPSSNNLIYDIIVRVMGGGFLCRVSTRLKLLVNFFP